MAVNILRVQSHVRMFCQYCFCASAGIFCTGYFVWQTLRLNWLGGTIIVALCDKLAAFLNTSTRIGYGVINSRVLLKTSA